MARWPVVLLLAAAVSGLAAETPLDEAWRDPPPAARTRAYWWWLNGNVDAAAITRDLEGMKAKGFGGAVIFDAGGAEQKGNNPVPAGSRLRRAACSRPAVPAGGGDLACSLELSLNIQSQLEPGAAPAASADYAVKQLAWSSTIVAAPGAAEIRLADPPRVEGYYRDTRVMAYRLKPGRPDPAGGVADWKIKALEAPPVFSGPNAWFLKNSAPRTDVLVRDESDRPGEEDVQPEGVVDLTDRLGADGRLDWRPPAGRWEILRFGYTLGDSHLVSTSSAGGVRHGDRHPISTAALSTPVQGPPPWRRS